MADIVDEAPPALDGPLAPSVSTFYVHAAHLARTKYDCVLTFQQYETPLVAGTGEVRVRLVPQARVFMSFETARRLRDILNSTLGDLSGEDDG